NRITIEGRVQAPAAGAVARPAPVTPPQAAPRPAPPMPEPAQASSAYSRAADDERPRIQQEMRRAQSESRERAQQVMRARPQRPAMVARPPGDPMGGLPIEQPRAPEVVPYEGKLLQVMSALKGQRRDEALKLAQAWRDEEPGDVLALIGLGES